MNTNLNPRIVHAAAGFVKIASILGIVLSFPGVSVFAPWAGVLSGVIAGVSQVVQSQVLGNVPAK